MNENSTNQKGKDISALLQSIGSKTGPQQREVIYGIYDRSAQPLLTRIDDFLIDHSRVPLEEKTYFFHLLAVMIDAGVPLIQALTILANRSKSQRFYRVLQTIAFSIRQGKKLSESMARFPDVFGEMEVGVVRSGEAVGSLDKMLFRLSDELEKSHALQTKLWTASVYPIAVLSVLVLVATGMLIWVIPSIVNLLHDGGLTDDQFPFTTRLLVGISGFFIAYWWALLFLVALGIALFRVYTSSDNGRFHWHHFILKIPVVGLLKRRILVLRFVSMLGILIESGLPVLQTLKIIAASLNNDLYRLKTWEIIAKVQQGNKISTSLSDAPFLFPETVSQMIMVAEQSASIGVISEKIASHYEREIDNSLKRLTSLFEPILILFVGLVVALLALAVLAPIFQLSTLP